MLKLATNIKELATLLSDASVFPLYPIPVGTASNLLEGDCRCLECVEVVEIISDRKWNDLTFKELITSRNALFLLSKEAMTYYISAYLLAYVENMEADEFDRVNSIENIYTYLLTQGLKTKSGSLNPLARSISGMSKIQRKVMRDVFQLIAEKSFQDGSWTTEIDPETGKSDQDFFMEALEQPWFKDQF